MKKFLLFTFFICICQTLVAHKIDTTYCDESLSDVLRHLNRSQSRYVINFMYDELEDFRVTATVRNKSVPEALSQIVGFYPVRVKTIGNNEIYVETIHPQMPRYTGCLTDEKHLPLAFANVALLSSTDSTLLAGGVTNSDGRFVIPCPTEKVIARISYVGYRTLYFPCETFKMGVLQMQPDTLSIPSVVVNDHSPFLCYKRGKQVFYTHHIAGVHHATDLLRYMPGLMLNGNNLSLLGKEGVVFCINGKEQRLASAEILQMLSSFPASEVERIEIDHTPAVQYQANGISGVINLILKKKDNDYIGGAIGSAHTQYIAHDDEATANVAFNQNGVSSLLNMAGVWDNTRYRESAKLFFPRVIRANADKGHITNHHYIARWQMDYNVTERLALGAYAMYAKGRRKLEEEGEYVFGENIYGFQDFATKSQRNENTNSFSLNTNVTQSLGLNLGRIDYNLDFYRMRINELRNSETIGSLLGNQNNESSYLNDIHQYVNNYSVKADVTIASLKAGVQYAYTHTLRNLSDTWQGYYTERSDFVYDEQVLSTYAEYAGVLVKRFSFRLGGRYEQTWTMVGERENSRGSTVQKHYGRFFPTLNFNYTPSESHFFEWNISSHIERPNILNVNPDTLHYDALNFSTGNPNLKPSCLYKVAMEYTYKGILNLNLFYAYQPDRMTRIRFPGCPNLFTTWDNMVDEQSLGVNSFYSFGHLHWMNALLMQSVRFGRFKNSKQRKAPIVQGWTYAASLQTSFFLDRKRKWTANLNLNYTSREQDLFQSLGARCRADVGLQCHCCKKRLLLNLAIRNLITSRTKGRESFGATKMYFDNFSDYRQLRLSLTYNWGAKLRQNRKSYNSDEVQKRVVNDF